MKSLHIIGSAAENVHDLEKLQFSAQLMEKSTKYSENSLKFNFSEHELTMRLPTHPKPVHKHGSTLFGIIKCSMANGFTTNCRALF